ncbi:hypothetical protein WK59_18970 [Burkholderia ubonensis]|uniref:DUF2442 domain-containing protein n=1 Tax=Burkholderia ubonensis TaxID=101571 RepID=UPI0007582983|nr:DUF2442 domain-containing protein [Burkholderia ubonensis]KVT81418.1 hypothetical protein WK59_18970 [Burkholderia ubonensis]KWK74156.1 hypothetical protein WM15_32400 [Burkholderia ubonensis]
MKIVKALDSAPPVERLDELKGVQSQIDEVVVLPRQTHLIYKATKFTHVRVQAERVAPVAESVRYFPEGRILAIYLRGGKFPVNIHVDDVAELTDLPDELLAHIRVAFAGTVLTLEDHDLDISVEGLLRSIGGSGGVGPGGHSFLGKGSFRFR